MKLLKALCLFLLLGGDFRLKPASLEANFPQPAPASDGRSNILFAPCSLLLDRPMFIGGTALIVSLIFVVLSGFRYSLCRSRTIHRYRIALIDWNTRIRFYLRVRWEWIKFRCWLLWLQVVHGSLQTLGSTVHKVLDRNPTTFEESKEFHFIINGPNHNRISFSLQLSKDDSCAEIFAEVEKLTRIPRKCQMLLYQKNLISPNHLVHHYNFTKESTIDLSVKGLGGGESDDEIEDECISCGEKATLSCKECKSSRCQTCSTLWHKHVKRSWHQVQELISKPSAISSNELDGTTMEHPSQKSNDDSQDDELDLFDSIASTVDLDEAAKRCVLADKFHLTHFKDFQSRIINAVLNNRDALVIQPTGSGKSLCFQFPAIYSKKLTLVITPTISLMQDQTYELSKVGINATYLGSAQFDPHAESKVFSQESDISLLFVSPEWLFGRDDKNVMKIQSIHRQGRLGLIAIDEAHLMYDWQDFRQSYKRCEELHTLFPGTPLMALSATVTPQVQRALETFLHNPVVERSTVNRDNIFLAAEKCNFRRADGSRQSISLDSRDFNTFADRVKEIISDKCTIVYTDFACHVAPIVLALRDRNLQAVGYYGKMKEGEKTEAYYKWKCGEVQIIVATRAFGLGINKPDVRFVIRNGLPPSICAWAQECGRAGRDGKQSSAYILYSDNDIQHVGFWARDMAKQHRSNDINDSAQQFSDALPFSYAQLAGKCRRKVLVGMFGERDEITCPTYCCDVCEMEVAPQENKKLELSILIKAIDELGKMGEVKITEWIRGGQIAWMKSIQKAQISAHGKSPPGLSKEWWRSFIRQCSAAGYIARTIKPATYGQTVQGSYASLQPTEEGRTAVACDQAVLLPEIDAAYRMKSVKDRARSDSQTSSRIRTGKGKHMSPILKELLTKQENWINLTEDNKERYQYPGWHESHIGNALYYASDVTKLPHYSVSDPHFLWSDIQLSKTSTSKNKLTIDISGKSEELFYWMSSCKGVKKCRDCDHVVSSCFKKNNCKDHPTAELVSVQNCPVEFIYVFPTDSGDHRRWIGGIIRCTDVRPKVNLHSHPVELSLSHKLPSVVTTDIDKTLEDNPYLTTQQLASGQGLGYRPGSADIAGTSYGRLDYHRKKSLRESGLSSKGVHIISDLEKIADKIDQKDCSREGSTITSKRYKELGRPYMRDYSISPSSTYQFIMTPLMAKLLSEADFLETDTTYNENTELIYLFNATVFDFNTMKWAVVARMRGNKEDADFYKKAFSLMFHTCHSAHPHFKVGESLKGIIVDWSDTETKGLREAVGEDIADRVLRGCNVHWARSYQRVADRVNGHVQKCNKKIANEAFCAVAKRITTAKTKEDVLRLFDVLQGAATISSVNHLKLPISEEHVAVVDSECDWSGAKSWVQWWTRNKHLQMLAKPFSVMSSKDWDSAPRNTNGVERANSLAKSGGNKPSLYAAMQSLYEKDKMFALQYIAAENGSKITYRSPLDEEQRSQAAVKRKRQEKKSDKNACFGPPDKRQHFTNDDDDFEKPPASKRRKDTNCRTNKSNSSRREVEVLYADGVWYKGWLSSYNFETGRWIVEFYDDSETTEVNFPDDEVRLLSE